MSLGVEREVAQHNTALWMLYRQLAQYTGNDLDYAELKQDSERPCRDKCLWLEVYDKTLSD
jgi:hypothetical protein